MKNNYKIYILLLIFFFFQNYNSYAQESTDFNDNNKNNKFLVSKVGAIDIGHVLRYAKATDKVRELLDGKRKEFQKEFLTKELELAEEEKKLKLKKEIMSKEAYQESVRKFQSEVTKVQKQIQQKRQSLDNAFHQAQDRIRGLTLEIVKEVAKTNNLDFVFNRENVAVFKQHYDITNIVLSILNERTKNARFEIEEKKPNSEKK